MLLAVLYCVLLFIWYLLGFTPIAGWWAYRLAALFTIWLYLPLPALLLYAIWRRSWRALALFGVPLALLALQYGYLLLPRQASESGVPLRVMTANLMVDNADASALGAAIAREQPDLLAVQELTPALARSLAVQVGQEFPNALLYPSAANPTLGLYSRYPLSASPAFGGAGDGCPCEQATLDVNGSTVTVLNVHPPRPTFSFQWLGPVPVPTNYDTSERDLALAVIAARARAIGTPLVMMGDFNLSDQDGLYRALAGRLNDTFRESGRGLGYTFPTHNVSTWLPWHLGTSLPYFPLVRIDYIFASAGWAPSGAEVVDIPGSDHRSVVADLRLTASAASVPPTQRQSHVATAGWRQAMQARPR